MKTEFFSRKKRNSEILVREKFFRPPKLGARSPPLMMQLVKMWVRIKQRKLSKKPKLNKDSGEFLSFAEIEENL